LYASVIFPLAIPQAYSYKVPTHLVEVLRVGMRVEVPLKNKLYAGIVISIQNHQEEGLGKIRDIVSSLDKSPIVSTKQLALWQWMASYYCCTIGEVMNAAMPTSLKLESETKIIAHPDFGEAHLDLTDDEYLVAEAISIQNELTIFQIQDILNRKSIYPVIRTLLDRGIVSIKEELIEKYKPKLVTFIHLSLAFADPTTINNAFDLVTKSDLQTRALLAFVQLSKMTNFSMPASEVMTLADVDLTVIKAIAKKEIFTITKEAISRASSKTEPTDSLPPLNEFQQTAMVHIQSYLEKNMPVLLHGVTGSGKTRIYAELIMEVVKKGKQVLFLLPEIALTSHLVERLRANIPEPILVYHSRMNNNERVDIWNAVNQGAKIVISARSGLFLPFQDLELIVVDEEHDPSYKQHDPNPRYNARDTALYMANMYQAKIILGSATPSLESYHNAYLNKFGIVSLTERHGASILPYIEIIDLKKARKDKRFDGLLSQELIDAVQQALENKEQILIFQNRRGYSPSIGCQVCGWHAECPNCDVHLTLHKGVNQLKCHYCGIKQKKPIVCPACGSPELMENGFGTEKIEEHFKAVFPQAKIARLDMDTARTKMAYEKVIYEFENKEIDILIGTQMIAKGLDFANISLVGVINADGLLRYPDLRSNERAFQLLTQVAGRAGRRDNLGRVMIQSYSPEHPVLHETLHHLYASFYQREMAERKAFIYPPYYRMIEIDFLHKNLETAIHAAQVFVNILKPQLGNRLIGPSEPPMARVRGMYIQNVLIKFEKDGKMSTHIKDLIETTRIQLKNIQATKSVRLIIDVDPY
jgi:primosomal protein N' (replication factor Y) (superfamily II helicase)